MGTFLAILFVAALGLAALPQKNLRYTGVFLLLVNLVLYIVVYLAHLTIS